LNISEYRKWSYWFESTNPSCEACQQFYRWVCWCETATPKHTGSKKKRKGEMKHVTTHPYSSLY